MRRLSEQESEGRALATPPRLPPRDDYKEQATRFAIGEAGRSGEGRKIVRVGACGLARARKRAVLPARACVGTPTEDGPAGVFIVLLNRAVFLSLCHIPRLTHPHPILPPNTHSERERVASTTRRDQSLNDGDCSP